MTQLEIEQAVESIRTLFRETDRRLDRLFEETDRQFKETARQFKATDQRFEETRQEIAALSKSIRATENLFASQWDRLMEALMSLRVMGLFRNWGIHINQSLERIETYRDGEGRGTIGPLLMGDHALVVVAARSTLRVEDVRDLLEDLKAFPNLPLYRIYRGYRLFEAVAAALTMDEQADRYAYRQGLFVLTMGREGLVTIRNDDKFRPRDFVAGPGAH